jgi:hypothetical protein
MFTFPLKNTGSGKYIHNLGFLSKGTGILYSKLLKKASKFLGARFLFQFWMLVLKFVSFHLTKEPFYVQYGSLPTVNKNYKFLLLVVALIYHI